MATIRALDAAAPQSVTALPSAPVETPSPTFPGVNTAPALAPAATLRAVSRAPAATTNGLQTPSHLHLVRDSGSDKATLAAFFGGSVHDRAVAIQKMVNSCSFFGTFCISTQEERDIVGILNAATPEERPQLIGELAQLGVLDYMVRHFSRNDSEMLKNYIRVNVGGLRDPALIASTLSSIDIFSDSEVMAIATSLRQQLGDAQADVVLQMLVAKGMLSRSMPYLSPLYLYSSCDTFWDVLQQQTMATWLEAQRQTNLVKLESVLSTFPPNSLAAQQLRSQFDAQYTIERVNDQIATMSCLLQSRYQGYYQTNFPDWYRTHGPQSGDGFPNQGPSSGDGFPSPSHSGDGFPSPSHSGDGFPSSPSSGDGFPSSPSSSGDGFPSSPSSSGDGFPSFPSSPSSSGDGFPSSSDSSSSSSSGSSSSSSGDGF